MQAKPTWTQNSFEALTDGLPIQGVEHELRRLVVSKVDEPVPGHDAPVPIANKFDLQLLPWSKQPDRQESAHETKGPSRRHDLGRTGESEKQNINPLFSL